MVTEGEHIESFAECVRQALKERIAACGNRARYAKAHGLEVKWVERAQKANPGLEILGAIMDADPELRVALSKAIGLPERTDAWASMGARVRAILTLQEADTLVSIVERGVQHVTPSVLLTMLTGAVFQLQEIRHHSGTEAPATQKQAPRKIG